MSSGQAELVLISVQDGDFPFPDSCRLDGAPGAACQGRPQATPQGLGLDAGEDDVTLCGVRGDGKDRGVEGRGQRVVARRVGEADMRGLITAGPCVRLERCAGLRTSVARFLFTARDLAAHSLRGALLLALRFLHSRPHGQLVGGAA